MERFSHLRLQLSLQGQTLPWRRKIRWALQAIDLPAKLHDGLEQIHKLFQRLCALLAASWFISLPHSNTMFLRWRERSSMKEALLQKASRM